MEGQGEIVSDTGTTTKGPRAHRKVGSQKYISSRRQLNKCCMTASTSYPSTEKKKIPKQGKDRASLASGHSSILVGKTSSSLLFSSYNISFQMNTQDSWGSPESLQHHMFIKTESKIRGYRFTFEKAPFPISIIKDNSNILLLMCLMLFK